MDGNIAPLRQAASTPGVVDGYSVSDILLQHSYKQAGHGVQPLLGDAATWTTLLQHATLTARSSIGDAAYAEGHRRIAEQAWHLAAKAADVKGMRRLGWLCTELGRQAEAQRWFHQAIDLGDSAAMLGLGFSLRRYGKTVESLRWIRRAAELEDPAAMVALGFELQRANQLEAETWFKRAASVDNAVAMANLGYLMMQRGDTIGAEYWNRRGAELGNPGAMDNLADLLKSRGQVDEALSWYRRAANRALDLISESPLGYHPWPGEAQDVGVSNAIMDLAELLMERGDLAEAELWFHRIAELGDSRAAAALADLHVQRGELSVANEWLRRAAELAHENLLRNKRTLLSAYGEKAVIRHVRIVESYANHLIGQGDIEAADEWHLRASNHLSSRPQSGETC